MEGRIRQLLAFLQESPATVFAAISNYKGSLQYTWNEGRILCCAIENKLFFLEKHNQEFNCFILFFFFKEAIESIAW